MGTQESNPPSRESSFVVPSLGEDIAVGDAFSIYMSGGSGTLLENLASDQSYQEEFTRLEKYLRSYNAADFVDAFHITTKNGLLCDIVMQRFPRSLRLALLEIVERSAISLTAEDAKLFSADLKDFYKDDIWLQIKNFFTKFIAVSFDHEECKVPIFAARPISSQGGKFDIALEQSRSNSFGFKVTVPGFIGGFSRKMSSSVRYAAERQAEEVQFQANVLFLVKTWRNNKGDEIFSYSPRYTCGSKATPKSKGEFIEYDTRQKAWPLDTPHENQLDRATTGRTITRGATDYFLITLPMANLSATINVESETESRFTIKYDLEPDVSFIWVGIGQNCHDFFAETNPSAELMEMAKRLYE